MKCECGKSMKVVEFIKSDGTTNRPYDRVILECSSCGSVTVTRYDPRDDYNNKQRRDIERMIAKRIRVIVSSDKTFEEAHREAVDKVKAREEGE